MTSVTTLEDEPKELNNQKSILNKCIDFIIFDSMTILLHRSKTMPLENFLISVISLFEFYEYSELN